MLPLKEVELILVRREGDYIPEFCDNPTHDKRIERLEAEKWCLMQKLSNEKARSAELASQLGRIRELARTALSEDLEVAQDAVNRLVNTGFRWRIEDVKYAEEIQSDANDGPLLHAYKYGSRMPEQR